MPRVVEPAAPRGADSVQEAFLTKKRLGLLASAVVLSFFCDHLQSPYRLSCDSFKNYKTHVHDSIRAHFFNNPQFQRLHVFHTKTSTEYFPFVFQKLARAMYR